MGDGRKEDADEAPHDELGAVQRTIEVTDNAIGDAPILPELLAQIPQEEPIDRVSSDGAYDTRACHAAIAQRGSMVVIPPRKNGRPWKQDAPGVQTHHDALRACQRLGPKVWRSWNGYHRRSLVETKMHCFKLLGERVTALTFERQVVELHVRVALLNRFTQLGRPEAVAVA